MKVFFKKVYEYEPSASYPYRCRILVLIPTNSEGEIEPEFRSPDAFLGEYLYEKWGTSIRNCDYVDEADGARYKEKLVTELSWLTLDNAVDREIDEMVETLRSVVKKNRQAMSTMPKSSWVEVEI